MPTVYGKVCVRHPELRGARYGDYVNKGNTCVGCSKARAKARRLAGLELTRTPEQRRLSREKALLRPRTPEERKAARSRRKQEQRLRRIQRAKEERDFAYLGAKMLRRYPPPRATRKQLEDEWVRSGGWCGLTGMVIPPGVRPHLDHIVPVSAGGSSTIDNLHWVHPMANHAKNSHSVGEFREWLLAAADALRARSGILKMRARVFAKTRVG